MIDLIDTITDLYMRPGYPHAAENRAVMRSMIAAQFASGRYVLKQDAAGRVLGFMAWLRTDEQGAALFRDYGVMNLAFLALPVAVAGDWLLVVVNAISPAAPRGLIWELKAGVIARNPRAKWIATYLNTRRGDKWKVRALR